MTDYLTKAIQSLRPMAEFVIASDDYSTISWHKLDGEAPTIDEINVEIQRIKKQEILDEKNVTKAKTELLAKLGITADEAALLLK